MSDSYEKFIQSLDEKQNEIQTFLEVKPDKPDVPGEGLKDFEVPDDYKSDEGSEKPKKKTAKDNADDILEQINFAELNNEGKLDLIRQTIDAAQNKTEDEDFDEFVDNVLTVVEEFQTTDEEPDEDEELEEPEEEELEEEPKEEKAKGEGEAAF